MRRFLCLMILFAGLAVPSLAQANLFDFPGMYVGAMGGANWLQKDYKRHVRYKTGYAVGAVAGFKTCEDIRLELEFMYRNNQRHSGYRCKHRQSYSLMANAYYDFAIPCWDLTPYVGVGIGADWDRNHCRYSSNRRHKTRFAAQAIAGASYPISCNFDISADYRYHAAFRHGNNDHVKQNHTVVAGVKYYF